jgi:hypothetical protein
LSIEDIGQQERREIEKDVNRIQQPNVLRELGVESPRPGKQI